MKGTWLNNKLKFFLRRRVFLFLFSLLAFLGIAITFIRDKHVMCAGVNLQSELLCKTVNDSKVELSSLKNLNPKFNRQPFTKNRNLMHLNLIKSR